MPIERIEWGLETQWARGTVDHGVKTPEKGTHSLARIAALRRHSNESRSPGNA